MTVGEAGARRAPAPLADRIPPEMLAVSARHGRIRGGRRDHFNAMHCVNRPERFNPELFKPELLDPNLPAGRGP